MKYVEVNKECWDVLKAVLETAVARGYPIIVDEDSIKLGRTMTIKKCGNLAMQLSAYRGTTERKTRFKGDRVVQSVEWDLHGSELTCSWKREDPKLIISSNPFGDSWRIKDIAPTGLHLERITITQKHPAQKWCFISEIEKEIIISTDLLPIDIVIRDEPSSRTWF